MGPGAFPEARTSMGGISTPQSRDCCVEVPGEDCQYYGSENGGVCADIMEKQNGVPASSVSSSSGKSLPALKQLLAKRQLQTGAARKSC